MQQPQSLELQCSNFERYYLVMIRIESQFKEMHTLMLGKMEFHSSCTIYDYDKKADHCIYNSSIFFVFIIFFAQ